jgi:hypothetical protein
MIALYLTDTGSRQHVCRVMMVVAMGKRKHFETHASEPSTGMSIIKNVTGGDAGPILGIIPYIRGPAFRREPV